MGYRCHLISSFEEPVWLTLWYLTGARSIDGMSSNLSPLILGVTAHTAHHRHRFNAFVVFAFLGGRADASG